MLDKINLEKILFLDIETVPQVYDYHELDETTANLFQQKTRFKQRGSEFEGEVYGENAGILAEFGKIVCISVGYIQKPKSGVVHNKKIRMKSFYHHDEETLLRDFAELLNEYYSGPQNLLCGHNGKEFDFPYIARRMLILGIKLPIPLDIAGKKPWEVNHLDTLELWKFGDYKHFTSLPLLCHIFKIPTPKDDISGADVARVYYEDKDLERIKVYCEKDVVALIQLFLKMKGDGLVEESDIIYS
ncbi:3'-5' exonuclease [Brumimicrobium mesophilum]|uniref:3'-5' exonuclease n=1 Tax=Brumimicrobium mesophilum TaxID=392717 RepID=UPI000D13FFCC|nr:3'-5' exonuclease [Brumimicrobium mesophilum]